MTRKKLLNFSITSMDDIERKGNMRYVEHYLTYFDEYVGVYVWGSQQRERTIGNTSFICAGTGHGGRDLLMSPWRIYRAAQRHKVTHFLTADLVYGWWHALLVRVLMGAKVVAMPVCTPPEILKNTGRTYSGFSPGIENFLTNLTFMSSKRIIVASNSFATRRWLQQLWCRNKVQVVTATPEELPSVEFLDRLNVLNANKPIIPQRSAEQPVRLIYVGRLETEKHVGDLIDVAHRLNQLGKAFELHLIGDGSERAAMEQRARTLGVADKIKFLGFQPAERVAEELLKSDIFVSTLTGTALKEAAFTRVATVAYAIDYIPDLLTHREQCLLAREKDSDDLAQQVIELIDNPQLRKTLADNLYEFATDRWSPAKAGQGLQQAFGDL